MNKMEKDYSAQVEKLLPETKKLAEVYWIYNNNYLFLYWNFYLKIIIIMTNNQ